jgi:multiple antibiotic resistance protein
VSFILIFKKLVTLLAVVDPFSMVPVYLGAVDGRLVPQKLTFAREVGITVACALIVTAFAGGAILNVFGISLGSMQVAGGILALILAVAMVLGKEEAVKQGHCPKNVGPKVVPLAMPLMVGPAAISVTLGGYHWAGVADLPAVVLPPVLVGVATWLTFSAAAKAGKVINASALDLIEKVGGFLLAAMAVEMVGTGLKSMFPALGT